MATAIEELTDDEPEVEDGDEANETPSGQVEDHDDNAPEDDDEDEIIVGDQRVRGEEESEGMRNLRNRLKEVERQKRELEDKVKPAAAPKPKPDLDDYWDRTEEYERELLAWNDAERERKDRADAEAKAAERAQAKWTQQHSQFEDTWNGLKISGKDAARAKVEEAFDTQQQAMLVKAARGNAALFAVLGTNPDKLAKLKELADDPAEFIAEAAVMASEVQVKKRQPTTQPETVHQGGGGTARANSTLERLEAEANRTGDRSKLIAYRAAQNK